MSNINKMSNHWEFAGHRIVWRVFTEGLWKNEDEKGNLLLDTSKRINDTERVIAIAQEETSKEPFDDETTIVLPQTETLNRICREIVRSFIEDTVDQKWLTREIVELTFCLTKPEDIEIVEMNFAGAVNIYLTGDQFNFPKKKDKRPKLYVNELIVKNWISNNEGVSKKLNLRLTKDQILEASLCAIGVHEWSHSIERALGILYRKTTKESGLISNDGDRSTAIYLSHSVVFEQAKKITRSVIEDLLDRHENNAFSMHTERFASGFDREATRFSLKKNKVHNKTVRTFIKTSEARGEKKLDEFKKLRKALGLNDYDLSTLFFDVREIMRDSNFDKDYVESLWDDLGYFVPYRREELEQMIALAYENIRAISGSVPE